MCSFKHSGQIRDGPAALIYNLNEEGINFFILLHMPLSVSFSLYVFSITQYFSSAPSILRLSTDGSSLSFLSHLSPQLGNILLVYPPCSVFLFTSAYTQQIETCKQAGVPRRVQGHLHCTLFTVWRWIDMLTCAKVETIFFLC